MEQPRVLITEPLAQVGIDMLKSCTQLEVRLGLKSKELIGAIADYDALIVRSETKVTAEVIEAGKKLQVIGRAGVGVDNIDVEAATRRGIVVVNAPTANTVAAAEHTIALMLSLARHVPQAHALLTEGVWRRAELIGVELRSKTLGVIGLGNVGSGVARRAQGLEMRVIGYDPYLSQEYAHHLGVTLVTLEELLRTSDFITLHVPLTEATRGVLGARELALVKPSVRIINAARGGLIDEAALSQALAEGRVAGAALDVFAVEPPGDNILFKSPKVIVTPHIAGSTAEAQTGVALDVAQQVLAVLGGKPAPYAVNAPYIPPELYSILSPFLPLCLALGRLSAQLAEGLTGMIQIRYAGEISNYDTHALKATVLRGLLEEISVERVNLVNADQIAQRRGLRIAEVKEPASEIYPSLITVEISTASGTASVAGTSLRGEAHIVGVNSYRVDIVPTGGYFLFCDHRDRPGLIGAVGSITGQADINIHSMQLSRKQLRGEALMMLGLDEPPTEEVQRKILAIPDIYTAKVVKL